MRKRIVKLCGFSEAQGFSPVRWEAVSKAVLATFQYSLLLTTKRLKPFLLIRRFHTWLKPGVNESRLIRAGKQGTLRINAVLSFLAKVLAAGAAWAGPIAIPRQVVALPENTTTPLFVDVEGNGRANLLALDPVEKKLLNYRQGGRGFGDAPDQSISLPPTTTWVSVGNVDRATGLELLFSTAAGIVYSRQAGGLFELERSILIDAKQPFEESDFPTLSLLKTNKNGTDIAIPVVSNGGVLFYRRNIANQWVSDQSIGPDQLQSEWSLVRESWASGGNPGHSLSVRESHPAEADAKANETPENDGIRAVLEEMKTNTSASPPRMDRLDVNGDGRPDVVLWQVAQRADIRTDLYVYLRGEDQKLPERPSQVLHASGFPIPLGSTTTWTPLADLSGTGEMDLVLVELKTGLTSTSGLIETALSHGLNFALTVRRFHNGAFSRSPETSAPLTMILPAELLHQWTIFIKGDFNGDGHDDLLVRRSETQWNVFFSTGDGRSFSPQPDLTFDTPNGGHIEILDLNGDGLSDVIWHEPDERHLSIFMAPALAAKSNRSSP